MKTSECPANHEWRDGDTPAFALPMSPRATRYTGADTLPVGATVRLLAASKEAGDHAAAGPFTKQALKDIAIGWTKDIPILGQLVDSILSQK